MKQGPHSDRAAGIAVFPLHEEGSRMHNSYPLTPFVTARWAQYTPVFTAPEVPKSKLFGKHLFLSFINLIKILATSVT